MLADLKTGAYPDASGPGENNERRRVGGRFDLLPTVSWRAPASAPRSAPERSLMPRTITLRGGREDHPADRRGHQGLGELALVIGHWHEHAQLFADVLGLAQDDLVRTAPSTGLSSP